MSKLFTWNLPRKAFTDQASKSQILSSLWSVKNGTSINSTGTLPLEIPTKDEIYANVAENRGNNAKFLKMTQGLSYAKELVKFYRHGVSVVWENNKKVRSLRKKQFKVVNVLDNKGNQVSTPLPRFNRLLKEMAQALYINFVENRTKAEKTTGEVVRTDSVPVKFDPELFLVSRAEFQLLRRTPSDFAKIPLFAVLAAIFMEMTPLLCYAIPEVTPLTCVLPSIIPRIWNSKSGKKLRQEVQNVGDLDDFALKTAYNLPLRHVHLLADTLRLKSKYVPVKFYPESVLRDRLQNYYNYLTVDNYYLSGLNGDGNIWNLDTSELVLAALERNLVEDIDEFVKIQSSGTIEARLRELEVLKLKLFQSVVNLQQNNVGYLAIGHLLPEPETSVVKWRK